LLLILQLNNAIVKILLIRNDKLGDFMLAWPAISLLKRQYPASIITVLVPAYTQPIAELCPWIDNILIDDNKSAFKLATLIKAGDYDASVSLFSELRTSLALWLARVPVRTGPATKIAQIFLNRRLRQKRSLSLKPEYEYNVDLAKFFIEKMGEHPTELQPPPYLELNPADSMSLREAYMTEHGITANYLIFIHPGSGGSAVNLTIDQYAQFAKSLVPQLDAHFVITAGPDELETARNLATRLDQDTCSIYLSTKGLQHFALFISICDLFISGSTGPLHIAGALNVPTVAFYPARRSATPLRWQTLNEASKRVSFSPDRYIKGATTLDIDIDACAREVSNFISNLDHN
jgi:ADP-heptose:LPS heptosyltransferase